MPQPPPDWDQKQLAFGASFLQSSLWGAFQQSIGHQPHFLMEDTWSCLLLQRKTKLGRYLFAPYGPTLQEPESLKAALSSLKSSARQSGQDWLRLEPLLAAGGPDELRSFLKASGAVLASHMTEPDLTRIIDLQPEADELLAAISQSTRSFIRKNQREKLLSFKTSSEPEDIRIFIKMLALVAKSQKIYFFPDEYFKKQAELLMPAGMLHLELALMDGRPIAGALLHDYGNTSSYTFAASMPEARQTNASALLLWKAMLNAKRRGMQQIDLFGIAPDDAPPSHPWQGFSSFKKKFGGEVVGRTGTWDLPISGKYKFYRQARKARLLIRRR